MGWRRFCVLIVAASGLSVAPGIGTAMAAAPTVDPFTLQCSADLFIESPVGDSPSSPIQPDVVFEEVGWSISGLTGHNFPASASLTVVADATFTADGQPVNLGPSPVTQTVLTDATGGFVTNISSGGTGTREAPGTVNIGQATVTVKNAAGTTLASQSGSGTCTST